MKQIIERDYKNDIEYKSYENDRGQWYGLYIHYWGNGIVSHKCNLVNSKLYGLNTWYDNNGKINEQRYFL